MNLVTPSRVTPHRGCTAADGLGTLTCTPFGTLDAGTRPPPYLGGHRDRLGQGPHQRDQLPGNGHDHLVGVFASGQRASKAFAQPHVRLPTRVLDRLGELCQAELQVPTHVGRIARGRGPVDEGPTGRGSSGLREASLVAARATGRCRRRQAPSAAAAPVGPRPDGRCARGHRPVGACGRARRPSRPGLGASDRASARLPRVLRHRRRPGGGLVPAACARVEPCRMAEGPWSPGR